VLPAFHVYWLAMSGLWPYRTHLAISVNIFGPISGFVRFQHSGSAPRLLHVSEVNFIQIRSQLFPWPYLRIWLWPEVKIWNAVYPYYCLCIFVNSVRHSVLSGVSLLCMSSMLLSNSHYFPDSGPDIPNFSIWVLFHFMAYWLLLRSLIFAHPLSPIEG